MQYNRIIEVDEQDYPKFGVNLTLNKTINKCKPKITRLCYKQTFSGNDIYPARFCQSLMQQNVLIVLASKPGVKDKGNRYSSLYFWLFVQADNIVM